MAISDYCVICGKKENLTQLGDEFFCSLKCAKEFQEKIELDCNDEIVCPFCGYSHQDSWEYQGSGEMDCHNCSNEFYYSEEIEVTYSSSKLDKDVIIPEEK